MRTFLALVHVELIAIHALLALAGRVIHLFTIVDLVALCKAKNKETTTKDKEKQRRESTRDKQKRECERKRYAKARECLETETEHHLILMQEQEDTESTTKRKKKDR